MITISLCMIVKNEEQKLRRCLDSLASIMDEIIIVDTGSTDQTKQIAAEYTENIYDYHWENDFSKARNFCISKATKEYIYVADADEVLDEENKTKFAQLKQILLPEIDVVQMKYSNQLEYNSVYNYDEEYRPKLFKRIREFYYVDPVHETLQVDPVIYDSEIVIQHKPHESHAKRDFETFLKAHARGERLGKRIFNMYAKELFIAGDETDFLDAMPVFAQAYISIDRSASEVMDAICVLTHYNRIQKNTVEFFKFAMKAMVTEPCSEICYELGEFYFEQQDYKESSMWFYNAIHESEPRLSLLYQGEYAVSRLADCYEKLGDFEKSKEYRKKI